MMKHINNHGNNHPFNVRHGRFVSLVEITNEEKRQFVIETINFLKNLMHTRLNELLCKNIQEQIQKAQCYSENCNIAEQQNLQNKIQKMQEKIQDYKNFKYPK